ncbi:MAG: NAD-dependent epimerase/dehydratase family protein [Chloroflexota bacterium]
MTILITGATGFVGGAMLGAYAEAGEDFVALTRRENDPHLTEQTKSHSNVRWAYGNIIKPDTLVALFEDVHTVIHAAGQLGAFNVSEEEYDAIHVDGTRNLLVSAAQSGIDKFLHVSSCGVQGPTGKIPQTEDYPYNPSNPYEYSKMKAERLALNFAKEGLPVVVCRPDFLYGPYDLHVLGLFRAIADQRYLHIGGGRATCVPTYIDDCVTGIMLAVERGEIGEVYHITGQQPVTFREMTQAIANELKVTHPSLGLPTPFAYAAAAMCEFVFPLVGGTPPLTRGAVEFFGNDHQFSYEKASRLLGYQPQTGLDEGVAKTIAWYRENGLI